jgi:hypothetical protein
MTVLKIALIALMLATAAHAAPLATATDGTVTLTLTDEPCKLGISNMQYRATWVEPGKTYEGCFTLMGDVVAFYFDDKSVAIAPLREFKPVRKV